MADLIIGITGHRPQKLGGFQSHPLHTKIRVALRAELERLRPSSLITGMALGVDQWAAEIARDLSIPFTAAVPFHGQESRWPPSSQAAYRTLLSTAEHVRVISSGSYSPQAMHRRNEWIVDHCSTLLAVWDGTAGGTAGCVAYATRRALPVIRIDPRSLR